MIATRYPMQHILTYAKLSPRHQSFAMAITTQREPTTYTQAAKLPQWQEAIQKGHSKITLTNQNMGSH